MKRRLKNGVAEKENNISAQGRAGESKHKRIVRNSLNGDTIDVLKQLLDF